MTEAKVFDLFEMHNEKYLKFNEIENPLHPRVDVCLMLKLHELFPTPDGDMISSVGHDIVYFGVTVEALATVATEEDIVYLVRCGAHIEDRWIAKFV